MKSKWKMIVLGTACVIVVCYLFIYRSSTSPITVWSVDSDPGITTVLDGPSAARFRKSYLGFGSIGSNSKVIPYAIFQLDGVHVMWTGNELERQDYPINGVCMTWRFPEGKAVIGRHSYSDGDQRLQQLIEKLQGR